MFDFEKIIRLEEMNDTQICSKCKVDKSLTEFNKDKYRLNRHKSCCRECTKVYKEENREKIKASNANYYLTNREERIAYNTAYRASHKKQRASYRANNREKIKTTNATWRSSPEGKAKLASLTLYKRYGLTLEERKIMAEIQDYRCITCLSVLPLVVDHSHVTGKVRGLLCNSCNLALGYAGDSISILKNMIKYLENNTEG